MLELSVSIIWCAFYGKEMRLWERVVRDTASTPRKSKSIIQNPPSMKLPFIRDLQSTSKWGPPQMGSMSVLEATYANSNWLLSSKPVLNRVRALNKTLNALFPCFDVPWLLFTAEKTSPKQVRTWGKCRLKLQGRGFELLLMTVAKDTAISSVLVDCVCRYPQCPH